MLTTCSVTTSVISLLGTTADERGLTTAQFKAKFDEAVTNLKAYLNDTLITEQDNLNTYATSSIATLSSSVSGKLDAAGGTMTGNLTAYNTTSYTSSLVRNMILSTVSATGSVVTGGLWIQYS